MPRALCLLVLLAFVVVTVACDDDPGAPPSVPIRPFGHEPATVTGSEPAHVNDTTMGSIESLCAQACANIESHCPGAGGGTQCAGSCATASQSTICGPYFRVFAACLATAPVGCSNGTFTAPACDTAAQNLDQCRGP